MNTLRSAVMTYQQLIDGIKRFGATEMDICANGTGVLPERVREN